VVYWLQNVLGIHGGRQNSVEQALRRVRELVEALARKQKIPLEWWEKGSVKKNTCSRILQKAEREGRWGVYFIFQTMEQGWTFRPDSRRWSRKTEVSIRFCTGTEPYRYYYFYLRDRSWGR